MSIRPCPRPLFVWLASRYAQYHGPVEPYNSAYWKAGTCMVGDLAHGAWVCVHLFTCARVVEEEGEEAKGESDADVCTDRKSVV